MRAMRCSMASAQSTAARAAPAPARAWRSSSPGGSSAWATRFVHESYIGSRFIGRVEEQVELAGHRAIVPSIEGSAIATGINTLWIDDADPFWRGFQVI